MGLVSGLVVGGIALAMMRSLINMPTDATVSTSRPRRAAPASSITAIPDEWVRRGHASATTASQEKYNARARDPIRAGTPVRVTAVLSASAVQVEPVDTD